MWEGEDFGHRISRYQRYPTGFTELQATRTACVSRVSPLRYQRYSASISRNDNPRLDLKMATDPRDGPSVLAAWVAGWLNVPRDGLSAGRFTEAFWG